MKKAGQISESGMTRRQWRDFAKLHDCASNRILAIRADFYNTALRSIRRGEPWREIFECGLSFNLNENGRAMLPKIP